MDYQAEYQKKRTTAAEAVKVVQSGDWVDYGWCTNHPVARLPGRADRPGGADEDLEALQQALIPPEPGGIHRRAPFLRADPALFPGKWSVRKRFPTRRGSTAFTGIYGKIWVSNKKGGRPYATFTSKGPV